MSAVSRFVSAFVLAAVYVFAAPVITGVYNAASWAPPGLPNSGIAEGSIFTVTGSALGSATLQKALSYPLPTSQGLGGTRLQVTVGGVTKDCIMVYTVASQVAAILPSATPTGNGTITLSYQGSQASAAINVLAANFGLFGLNEAGSGPGVFTDPAYNVITLINAAHPGDTLIAWGTGLGPITGDETLAPPQVDLNTGAKVFLGGKPASVLYAGRGSSAGLDQINFVVPNGVQGCKVSVAISVAGITSNFTTIPVAPAGQSVCSDPDFGVTAADLQKAQASGGLRVAALSLSRTPWSADEADATFATEDLNKIVRSYGFNIFPSPGSCVVYETIGATPEVTDPIVPSFLDAGPSLSLSGHAGTKTLTPQSKGSYTADLGGGNSGMPPYLSPGNYIMGGSGGGDVGAFNATLTIPQPAVSTLPAMINRAEDLTIGWTGGASAAAIVIVGLTAVQSPTPGMLSIVEFGCGALPSAAQLTIPSHVLAALPAAGFESNQQPGVDLAIFTVPVTRFAAPGVDTGLFTGLISGSSAVAAIR